MLVCQDSAEGLAIAARTSLFWKQVAPDLWRKIHHFEEGSRVSLNFLYATRCHQWQLGRFRKPQEQHQADISEKAIE